MPGSTMAVIEPVVVASLVINETQAMIAVPVQQQQQHAQQQHTVVVAAPGRSSGASQTGPLLTRLTLVALGLAAVGSAVGLVATVQFTTATTTRSVCKEVCPVGTPPRPQEGVGYIGCAHHCFIRGWCAPGDIEQSGDDVPCPDETVNKWAITAEAGVALLLWSISMALMAAFPGCCSCEPCTSKTTCRVLCFVVGWALFALNTAGSTFIGLFLHTHYSASHDDSRQLNISGLHFGGMLVAAPLLSIGMLTLSRCISRTCETSPAAPVPPAAAANRSRCVGIALAMLAVVVLVPVLHHTFVVDEDVGGGSTHGGGGGYGGGYGGGGGYGSLPEPECEHRAEVQYWSCDCSAFPPSPPGQPPPFIPSTEYVGGGGNPYPSMPRANPMQLRTLGAGGAAPDPRVGQAVCDWLDHSADTRLALDLPTLYPWLNPTCQDIGIHLGYDYCCPADYSSDRLRTCMDGRRRPSDG